VGEDLARLRRVLVIGPPGVGKSWVACRLADQLDIPHVELDGFKLRPGKTLASPEEFAGAVQDLCARSEWLMDGNWSDDDFAAEVWDRADLVVWLDYPRPVVMRQVVRRSVRRAVKREEYYGSREAVRDWLSPTHPMRWSWHMVRTYSDRYSHITERLTPAKYLRLRSRADAQDLIGMIPERD
jgi:adenylate kinase family enzyme